MKNLSCHFKEVICVLIGDRWIWTQIHISSELFRKKPHEFSVKVFRPSLSIGLCAKMRKQKWNSSKSSVRSLCFLWRHNSEWMGPCVWLSNVVCVVHELQCFGQWLFECLVQCRAICDLYNQLHKFFIHLFCASNEKKELVVCRKKWCALFGSRQNPSKMNHVCVSEWADWNQLIKVHLLLL